MKILLIAFRDSTFVIRDYNILSSNHEVTLFKFKGRELLKCFTMIVKHDLIFFWFASIRFLVPSIISKILRRKIIIVTGGYDVRKVESGSMSSIWKSIVVKTMLKLADKILAVSNSNKNEVIKNCKINHSKIEMVYHGFEEIKKPDLNKKTDTIVTIGYLNNLSFYRKGIDKFFKLSEILPDIEFHLIGNINFNLGNIVVPNNVVLHGHLKYLGEKFNDLLEKAKIYIQFSNHESFGCSVAEAMQFGCIPFVSNNFSLPEVVGNCGVVIKNFDNYKKIGEQIRAFLKNYNQKQSLNCIARVNKEFSYKVRAERLNEIIQHIT